MTDMRISVAEAERLIVDAIQIGWKAAHMYPDATRYEVAIEWQRQRLHQEPVVRVVVLHEKN